MLFLFLIIYVKKFLRFDWLRAVQFFRKHCRKGLIQCKKEETNRALRARAILLVWKIYSCLFIPNCTRNHVITHTNCTRWLSRRNARVSRNHGKIASSRARAWFESKRFNWSLPNPFVHLANHNTEFRCVICTILHFCTGITHFALVLHILHSFLSQSELSNFLIGNTFLWLRTYSACVYSCVGGEKLTSRLRRRFSGCVDLISFLDVKKGAPMSKYGVHNLLESC